MPRLRPLEHSDAEALYAIHSDDMNRVEADADPRNLAAARLLERLGFSKEGLLRERWIVDGAKSDSATYGLLRNAWKANG